MAFLEAFSGQSSALTATCECTVPAGATYCLLFVGMRGSNGGATTLSSATLGDQPFTLDSTNLREFSLFHAMQGGYILSADLPSGTVTATATRSEATDGMTISVLFFDGVLQSAPSSAKSSSSSGGDPFNTNITLSGASIIADGISASTDSAAFTTNQTDQTLQTTERVNAFSVSSFSSSREASSGVQTMGWDTSATSAIVVHLVMALENAAAGPSITASDPVVDGAQATITTSGLSGAITSTLGGYNITTAGTLPNLTYTLGIASITANGPVSVPRIGDSLTLSVTGGEGTATSTVATQAASGMAVVTLAGTLANETDSLIDKMQVESGLTIAVGDILYYSTADNTSIDATGALTTDATSFDLLLIQGGDADTAGSGYAFTITPEAAIDTSPTAFSFTDVTGQALNDTVESDVITVLGVDATTDIPVSIAGGEYAVDTGSGFGGWTSANTNVQLNYQIKVRVTTSASDVTGTSATLTVGGVSDTFTATTGDFTAPVITLTDGDVTVNQDSVWSDPGFSATDAVDGDVTADVVVTGTIDTSTLGAQTLTYTVSDAAGNETSDTRTVTVQEAPDTTDPVVVAPADITLEFPFGFSGLGQASSSVQNWLALATASDDVDGALSVSNNLGGQADPLPAGAYVVTFTATDAASNVGTDTATLTVVEADEPVASSGDVWNMGRTKVKARKLVKARTKVSAYKL